MDIEISLKPEAKKPRLVKAALVHELAIIGYVSFLQSFRRAMNNRVLCSRFLSLIPAHLLRVMDRFCFEKKATLNSIFQSFLAWIRNLSELKNFGILCESSPLRSLILVGIFGRMIKSQTRFVCSFPLRTMKESSIALRAHLKLDAQELFVDCIKNEVCLGHVADEFGSAIHVDFLLGDAINLSYDKANCTKRLNHYISQICSMLSLDIISDTIQPIDGSPISEIPQKASKIKNHPIYILESHLKKYEVLHPPEIAGFLDSETVYFRKNVRKLRSKEAWLTQFGMAVKSGEQPAKVVQLSSITKKLQDLYGEWQVEPYRPPDLVDGRIPRNNYGNVDMFTERMIPNGCYHETRQNAAKVAKSLSLEYAEACIGFSFHGGRAAPDISGIVLLQKDAQTFDKEYQSRARKIIDDEARKFEDEMLRFWDVLAVSIVSGRRLKKTSGFAVPQSNPSEGLSVEDSSSIFVNNISEDYSSFDQL